jgi:hypothetical protein
MGPAVARAAPPVETELELALALLELESELEVDEESEEEVVAVEVPVLLEDPVLLEPVEEPLRVAVDRVLLTPATGGGLLRGHNGGLAGDHGGLSGDSSGLAGDNAQGVGLGQVLSGRVTLLDVLAGVARELDAWKVDFSPQQSRRSLSSGPGPGRRPRGQ